MPRNTHGHAKTAMQTDETPNQALQRTAPHVTAAASGLRLSATVQPPRRAPRSLSLRR
jgi:hypothetical protein